MKKLFLLLICSAFSVIINAQTLFVENQNPNTMDVQGIAKLTSACNTTMYCAMTDMMGIVQWATPSQGYPTGCAAGPYINLTVFEGANFIQIQYCGTPQSGTWGPGNAYGYILTPVIGAYPDMKLTIN